MYDDEADEILKYALQIFDVAGVWENYLILGLESRKGRYLDTFFVDPGDKFGFPGFAEYFSPRVEEVLKQLHKKGFKAEQVEKLPNGTSFKAAAVTAGIGKWGRNSLVIHPDFGPWLRFVAIATDRYLSTGTASYESTHTECLSCQRCLKACIVSALKPFHIPDRKMCLAYQQLNVPTDDVRERCDLCLQACRPQRL